MAVYTKITPQELTIFLKEYTLDPILKFQGITAGSDNSNYILETHDKKFILTLYERRVNAHNLSFFFTLMNHLNTQAIPCPIPIVKKDNTFISYIKDKPVALFSFLKGSSIENPQNDHCKTLGIATAHLHHAGQNFEMKHRNTISINAWPQLLEECIPQIDEIYPNLRQEITREIATLTTMWSHSLPQGVIHGDLFPDNVFFMNNQLSAIIDFYFACHDAWAYDIAIIINAWCFDHNINFDISKSRAFFEGYQSVRPLTKAETEAMPILARGAALRFLLTRLYDTLHPRKESIILHDPLDYLARLHFHQHIITATDYGIVS